MGNVQIQAVLPFAADPGIYLGARKASTCGIRKGLSDFLIGIVGKSAQPLGGEELDPGFPSVDISLPRIIDGPGVSMTSNRDFGGPVSRVMCVLQKPCGPEGRGGGDRRGAIYHNQRLLKNDPKQEGAVRLTGWMEGRCDSIWWMAITWGGRFSWV